MRDYTIIEFDRDGWHFVYKLFTATGNGKLIRKWNIGEPRRMRSDE